LIGKAFNQSTTRGLRLEEYRKKILLAEKVREFDHILQCMNEMDLLKKLLLNEQQRTSLAFLQKPKNMSVVETVKKYNTFKISNTQNLKMVEEYFLKLINENEGNLNEKDQLIFNELNDRIKNNILKKSYKFNINQEN
jgi:hypothetical protein